MQNVFRLFFLPLVHVPTEQVEIMLETSMVAEVLLHGARVVINISLCRERCMGEVQGEVSR